MFGPVRTIRFLPLKSIEVFSDKGFTGSFGEPDMIPYSHGVMRYRSTGVLE